MLIAGSKPRRVLLYEEKYMLHISNYYIKRIYIFALKIREDFFRIAFVEVRFIKVSSFGM